MKSKPDSKMIYREPDFCFEYQLREKGVKYIAGIDEAGRGALAGPVAAGVVIFDIDNTLPEILVGVRDSKQMTASERQVWASKLSKIALTWGVGYASWSEIDSQGIGFATRLAMIRALESLSWLPEHLLIDFFKIPEITINQTAIVKGDERSLSIAAASIFAKHARDQLMIQYETCYPGYGFAQHKGYGTIKHRKAIAQLGPCPIHRRTFAPLKLISEFN